MGRVIKVIPRWYQRERMLSVPACASTARTTVVAREV